MAVKKASTAKETAEKKETVKPAAAKTEKVEAAAEKPAAKAIETKKDTTKKLETKAGVLVDTPEEKAAEKTTVKKAPAKKAAAKPAAKKTPAKKAPAKKAELKTEMYLQFYGKEYSDKEILQKVKEIWTKVLKNKVGDMKDVKIYLKPEESKAYYVINGDTTGEVDL